MTYNGWTNWATWSVTLYYSDMIDDLASRCDSEESLATAIEEEIERVIEDASIDDEFIREMVRGSVDDIDYRDLAETFWEERDIDDDEEDDE